jgi:hypothetical protein
MSDDDEGEVIICFGGAKIEDVHLASTIVAVDEEIFEWLEDHEHNDI